MKTLTEEIKNDIRKLATLSSNDPEVMIQNEKRITDIVCGRYTAYHANGRFVRICVPKKERHSLVGVDGNAFAIMGYVNRALRESGNQSRVEEYSKKARAGDYNNLVVVSQDYIDIANAGE